MEKLKFIYGNREDFNNNQNAIKLKDNKIQQMVDECVKRIEQGDDWSTFQATGDTIVFAFGFSNDNEHLDEIDVWVCKNYEQAEAWLNNKGDWKKMNWSKNYEEEEEYQDYSREELIDMLRDYRRQESNYYNPRREV